MPYDSKLLAHVPQGPQPRLGNCGDQEELGILDLGVVLGLY